MRSRPRVRVNLRLWLVIVAVVALLALQLPFASGPAGLLRDALLPLERALTALGNATNAMLTPGPSVEASRRETEALRAANAALEAENARLAELERQNAFLLAALGFKQRYPALSFRAAEVVSREPTNLTQALMIDRGRDDGVRPGLIVVTPRGVVGQITETTGRSATVLLLTDRRSSVDARTQQSDVRGLVSGLGRPDLLLMRYVRQGDFLYQRERVVTSGLGGLFPPGLPLGYVSYVRRRDVDAFQEAYVEPAANLDRIDRVLVVVDTTPPPTAGD